MKRGLALLLPIALAACQDTQQPLTPIATDLATPSFNRSGAGEAIPGQYIVVFKNGVADAPGLARRLTAAHGGTLRFTYEHAIKGFAAELPEAAVAALQNNPNVAYIEQDQVMYASGSQSPATWGLDRIDQRSLPLNNKYDYTPTGAGVKAYIIDTGIRTTHNDFGGRATSGYDAIDGGTADDCNGHGTHVAGTVGGATWGVAKGVQLVAVRVLDCGGSGTNSGVIAGVDWVTGHHVKPAVANMSLGGGASSTLDNAVAASISAGVTYAIAAGNGDFIGRPQNACNYSPARLASAITVGSTTSSDSESSFSNYGTCVDILAPGSSITSAWYQNDTQTNTISGTSMATPHVAGAAALYLQGSPNASPAQVASALSSNASQDKITLHSRSQTYGTPNLLLYTLNFSSDDGTTNTAPTVSISSPTSGSTVSSIVTIAANVSDNENNVAKVEFFVDNVLVGTDLDPSGGWSIQWNSTTVVDGSHQIAARATDAGGLLSNSTAVSVTVSNGSTPIGISLEVTGYKVKGIQHADLTWAGVTSPDVDIRRDGTKIKTVRNTSPFTYTDNIGAKGGGTYTYRVCEAGTTTCSNNVSVTF